MNQGAGQAGNTGVFDVVVVGSGAGGMLAACRAADRGLSVVVLEKSGQYGGTSAVSGGGIWIPLNHHIEEAGGSDNYDAALTYLEACTEGRSTPAKLRAYLEHGPRMLAYLEQRTGVRYYSLPLYADYFQRLPGALPGYRALDPMPFDGALLGEEFARLRPPSPGTLVAEPGCGDVRRGPRHAEQEPRLAGRGGPAVRALLAGSWLAPAHGARPPAHAWQQPRGRLAPCHDGARHSAVARYRAGRLCCWSSRTAWRASPACWRGAMARRHASKPGTA
ncbi:FAD-dependent oxidoreductase [Cupriavidus basilensis]